MRPDTKIERLTPHQRPDTLQLPLLVHRVEALDSNAAAAATAALLALARAGGAGARDQVGLILMRVTQCHYAQLGGNEARKKGSCCQRPKSA